MTLDLFRYHHAVSLYQIDLVREAQAMVEDLLAVPGLSMQLQKAVSKLDFTQTPNGSVLDVMLHPTAIEGEKGLDVFVEDDLVVVAEASHEGGVAPGREPDDPGLLALVEQPGQRDRRLARSAGDDRGVRPVVALVAQQVVDQPRRDEEAASA